MSAWPGFWALFHPPEKWSRACPHLWPWTRPFLHLHLLLGTEGESFPRATEELSVNPTPSCPQLLLLS